MKAQADWPSYLRDRSRTGHNPAETTLYPPLQTAWTSVGAGLEASTAIVVGNSVFGYCGPLAPYPPFICSFDLSTGSVLWQKAVLDIIGPTQVFPSRLAESGGVLYFTSTDSAAAGEDSGVLYALSSSSGNVLWTKAFPKSMQGANPVIDGEVIYLVAQWGRIYAIDRSTQAILWEWAPPGSQFHSDPVLFDEFLVYHGDPPVGSQLQEAIYGFDKTTGQLLWTDPRDAGEIIYSGTLFGNEAANLVYYVTDIATNHFVLKALDAASGALRWTFACSGQGRLRPGLAGDSLYYYCPNMGVGSLYVLDALSGDLTAGLNLSPAPLAPTAVTSANGVLYFNDNSSEGRARAFDATSGDLLWESPEVGWVWQPVILANGRALAPVSGADNSLVVWENAGTPADLPDLTTGTITFAPAPVLGELTTARVDVLNQGTVDAGPFQVTWYLDGSPAFSERRETALPAGSAIAFELLIEVQAEHQVRVVVDSLDEITESNESNNESVAMVELSPGSDRLSLSVSPQVLVTNAEGWYDNNPVSVEAVVSCPAGGTLCHDEFVLEMGGGGRFYVYETQHGEDVICPIDMGEPYSFRHVDVRCESTTPTGQLVVAPGETVVLRFSLWVQPTEATSLQVSATWGLDQASETVSIPEANIHPLVVIHGILGSQDPEDLLVTDQRTMHFRFDPFLGAYRPLFNQLQKMGYEWNKTLFGITYDWRQNNELSAAHLRNQLSGAIIPRSQGRPYVVGDGKADLVVHSMGGLVSRSYIQGPSYQDDVNKVIFTATPHKGFPFDYRTWEGMDWSNYLYDAWLLAGSTGALTPLMNNVLWPMQVYKKYKPDQTKLDDVCFFLPITLEISWSYLKVFYLRDGVIPGHYYCDKDAVAKWAHDGDDGIPSLQQMLPTSDMPQYLTASGGPPPYGVETNVWLEDLNADVQSLIDNIGGEDRLFTIYGDEVPETDFSYEVSAPFSLTPNVWRHGRAWGGLFGLQESSFGNIEEAANGDDLVPAASACLACGSNPLIPTLPAGNDHRIAGATHKGIMGHPDLQKVALPNFLAAQNLPFNTERTGTIAPLIRLAVIYSQCPVNLLVENAAGQRLGFDPSTGEVYEEIENAIYSGPQVEPQFIILADPDPETLNLLIAGYDSGEYSVRAMMIDQGGLFEAASFWGTTSDGQLDEGVIEIPAPTIVPTVTVEAPSVEESSGAAVFTLTLSESVERPISVDFESFDGTARSPADYEAVHGTLTFEPGETEKTLVVPLLDDTQYEGDETFTLVVVNLFNGEHTESVATLIDDDPLPTVKVGDTSVVEGAGGTTTEAPFPILLSSPSAFPVELFVQAVEGTAGPEDFIPKAGVVSIPPGEDSLLVAVTVLGDDVIEGNESFSLEGSECFVRMSASLVEPCSFLDPIGVGTILDDDEQSTTVSLEDARPVTEPEPGEETESVFRARLSPPSAFPVVLLYETEDGSATGGEDYAATRESVTVPAGKTDVKIAISVFGDSIPERTEDFFLRLTVCRPIGPSQPCQVTRDQARAVIEDRDVHTNYRSIGTYRGNLYDEGIAVWTGGNRFAFRGGRLPENVGIGDSFILDPGRDQVELFILSRLDATHLLVQGNVDSPPSGVRYAIRRAYHELGDWERERDGNLVRERRREVGVVYNDGPFRGRDEFALLTFEGSTANERYYMKLMAAPGHAHRGKAGTGVVLDGRGKVKLGIQVRDSYTQIEGIELRGFSSENGAAAIEVRYARHVSLDRLLIHDFENPKASVVGVKGSYESEFTLRNTIIYDGDTAGVRINRQSGRATIDNCTVFGMDGRGIYEDDGKMLVHNSISMNNGREDVDVTRWRQSNNMSSDGTATGPGSIPFANAEDQFLSLERGKEDFHLRSGADAIDRGEDRSEHFAHDVDMDPRPQGAGWDMGADEQRTNRDQRKESP